MTNRTDIKKRSQAGKRRFLPQSVKKRTRCLTTVNMEFTDQKVFKF